MLGGRMPLMSGPDAVNRMRDTTGDAPVRPGKPTKNVTPRKG